VSIAAPPLSSGLHDAWSWLTSLRPRGVQLGLERVREALARLGDPQARLAIVTVAGTNGKGSTAAFVAAIGHAAGYRVGLYTSPHLVSVTERIRVGGVRITPDDFSRWAQRLRAAVDGDEGRPAVPLTFFEALTVIALAWFDERDVDLAVLEVGLGGRLDATNAADPLVAVVTPVGLDHTGVLGDTREAICREKAGIVKPGATLVTSVDADLFRAVLGPIAFAHRCPIRRLGVDFLFQWLPEGFRYRGWQHRVGPVRLGLRGVHQAANAATACAVAESLAAHGFTFRAVELAEGLMRARHPGRLERREPTVDEAGEAWPAILLDAAHNPMGAATLARHVHAFLPERPRILVLGINPDKDVEGIMRGILPEVDGVVLTEARANPVGPWGPWLAAARRLHSRVIHAEDPADALAMARRFAGPQGGVLVTGSIYVLGEVWPHLPAVRWLDED